jgi:hypothetical protein
MRTFIFGAGASVHAGYPLASNLWRSMEQWTLSNFPEGHNFRTAVDTMRSEFDLSKSFELVLTDLDDRIEPFLKEKPDTRKGIEEKVRLVYLRVALRAMIPSYFNSLRSQPARLYGIFATCVLARGDAVITFNYDVALDRELAKSANWHVANGYGFELERANPVQSPIKLLKLHGSTNWRGELFRGMRGFFQMNPGEFSLGPRPVIGSSELKYLEGGVEFDPLSHDGGASIECLILPTARKKFFNETSLGPEWKDFWDSLWFQAGEALAASTEVYVIGYSAPEFDVRARDLLARKIDKRAIVNVCCHDGTNSVAESLRNLVESEVRPTEPCTFEGWLSSVNRLK